MSKIIQVAFKGSAMQFNHDGWFNATVAAERFGKRVDKWLGNQETQDYLTALQESSNTPKKGYLKTKRGNNGGTWLHPKLAIVFARWLDVRFAVWCDMQIDTLIRGQADEHQRVLAIQGKREAGHLLTDVLQDVLMMDGKTPKHYHFSNEHLLVNEVFAGVRGPVDESTLNRTELRRLEALRRRDAIYLARGLPYDERKTALYQFSDELGNHQGRLSA